MSRQQILDRLIFRTRRIVAETDQLVRDIEWWNANRNDAPPFDVGRDKVTLKAARDYLAHLETRPDYISDELHGKLLACFKDVE